MTERQKILIVDDKEENLFTLEKTLRDTGAVVVKAPNGSEALAATLHNDFALAILDVHMPGMSGFELADHLRGDEKTKSLPIIFLTATFLDEENAFKGYEAGAVDYIIKPFNPVILNGKVEAFLELARYRTHLEDVVRDRTDKSQHINQILLNVRNVNQLIVREHDDKQLIRKACKLLVEARGFDGAWIALLDDTENPIDIAHDGFGAGAAFFAECLRSGSVPPCGKKARQSRGVAVIENIGENCEKCPLKSHYQDGRAMSTVLEHGGQLYGFIGLALPTTMAIDEEERSIFQEVAGDIAYALHNIQISKERQQAIDALQEREELYRAIFNNASVGIDVVDRYGKFLEVNDTLCRFIGYTLEEFRNLTILDITHPDDRDKSAEMHAALVRGETEGYRFEKQYVRKDDSVCWADTAVSAIRGTDRHYRATVGVISDITHRKKSDEARVRLEAAIEQSDEAVVITDADGVIQHVNPATERITGFNRSEIVGNTHRIFKSGEHDRTFYEQLWTTIKGGRVWSGRIINRKKDGTLCQGDATISPVRDASGNIINFVSVTRDVTEHLELSRQLFQAQKMEAIGTLAGGVAHDFNNILQVMLGYSELLLGEEDLSGKHRSDLHKIYDSAKRGADLVQRLLTFSRKTEIRPQPLNLNRRIADLRKMLERTIPKMIDIKLHLGDTLPTINADPTQIDQVLMNLAVNARDAMPEGGKLIIETAGINLDQDYVRVHVDAKPGPHVLLTVADNGSGIEKDTLDHIFEPFYTTKEVGEGTGLGLAMVHGIVKQHGGHIKCYSEPGDGTTFKIYLPALVAEEDREQTTVGPMPAGGSETILLVDDEDFIRDLGSRILTKAGYRVVTASNGEEALAVYRNRGDQISLVILDLIMPVMGGKQCLDSLLAIDPSIKIVIASGFSADGPTRETLVAGAKGFIDKPYNLRKALEVIRNVLDAE